MNWISFGFLIALSCFVVWLTIDTIIYVVKKIKSKKNKDQINNSDVDNTK